MPPARQRRRMAARFLRSPAGYTTGTRGGRSHDDECVIDLAGEQLLNLVEGTVSTSITSPCRARDDGLRSTPRARSVWSTLLWIAGLGNDAPSASRSRRCSRSPRAAHASGRSASSPGSTMPPGISRQTFVRARPILTDQDDPFVRGQRDHVHPVTLSIRENRLWVPVRGFSASTKWVGRSGSRGLECARQASTGGRCRTWRSVRLAGELVEIDRRLPRATTLDAVLRDIAA